MRKSNLNSNGIGKFGPEKNSMADTYFNIEQIYFSFGKIKWKNLHFKWVCIIFNSNRSVCRRFLSLRSTKHQNVMKLVILPHEAFQFSHLTYWKILVHIIQMKCVWTYCPLSAVHCTSQCTYMRSTNIDVRWEIMKFWLLLCPVAKACNDATEHNWWPVIIAQTNHKNWDCTKF